MYAIQCIAGEVDRRHRRGDDKPNKLVYVYRGLLFINIYDTQKPTHGGQMRDAIACAPRAHTHHVIDSTERGGGREFAYSMLKVERSKDSRYTLHDPSRPPDHGVLLARSIVYCRTDDQ